MRTKPFKPTTPCPAGYTDCEVWIVVNSNGECAVGTDDDNAQAAYENDIGGSVGADDIRRVKVTIRVKIPVVAELGLEVEDDAEVEPAAV